jgi:signal transduction histidine kinase
MPSILYTVADLAVRLVPGTSEAAVYLLDANRSVLRLRALARASPGDGLLARRVERAAVADLLVSNAVHCLSKECQRDMFVNGTIPEGSELLLAPLQGPTHLLGGLAVAVEGPYMEVAKEHLARYVSSATWLVSQALAIADAERGLPLSEAPDAQLLERAVAQLREGVVLLDAEGRVCLVNASLCQMIGLDAEALVLPMRPGTGEVPQLDRLLDPSAGRVVGAYDVVLPRDDGPSTILRISPSHLDGQIVPQVYIVTDITSECQTAEDRSMFLSQVAHELRTPLQHILGFASILADVDDLPEETRTRFLGHISDESRRLARLVDDLAEMARAETGHFVLRKSDVRLGALLEGLIERLKPAAARRQVTLTYAGLGPLPSYTDGARVEQVVRNLVENAVKFVQPGGSICVEAYEEGEGIVLKVTDTGPGIPRDVLPRVFERFFQGSQYLVSGDGSPLGGTSSAERGMGLGLYISREIVHSLGGEIWVESELGTGCTFYVRLPRK